MGFLPFTPRVSLTVFGLLWASFQDYPLTHWLPLPLLSTCLLQRYSFHDKIPFCLFLLYTSTSRWLNKDWAISWPSSMACIRWSLLLVLFHFAACFVLYLHTFPATFVIFLWFGFSFLHVIPAADTSCRSLFLFVVLLHINFHAYPFIQKNLGLCGLDNIDWIKRVLGPIYLCLPNPFCQRTLFCGKFVFCGRFVFCCKSLSLTLLSLDLSCSLVFLAGLWALLFIGLSSSWYGFKKWASTFSLLSIWIAPAIHMQKLMQFFFRRLFHNSHANASLLSLVCLLFQSLLSLSKLFSFFMQIYDPPMLAKKKKKFLFMRVVVLLLSPQSEFVENFASFGLSCFCWLPVCYYLTCACRASFGPVVCFPFATFQ